MHTGANVHLLLMDLQNACARFLVRQREFDLTVETARAKQRRIENVNAICG